VLTTLDRLGCPLLRYRTGDFVIKARAADGGLLLAGGILSRTDDMVVVRGVNIYPSAIEGVLRLFPEVAEYQVREEWLNGMLELRLVVEFHHEADASLAPMLEKSLTDALALRIPVEVFPPGSLPRFEFKARRWVKAPLTD
jgi:phenylacetate-CoA ligase